MTPPSNPSMHSTTVRRSPGNSTLLMTVTGLIKRSLQETTLDGGTASLVTQYRARVDHEIDRQILLNAELDFQTTDIEGVARKDDLYSIGIGAKYMLLRYLYLSGDYRYQRKISTADQGGFSRNQFMFRVEVQY